MKHIFALLILISANAFASVAVVPTTSPILGQVGFDTMDAAAIDAEHNAIKTSRVVEYAGVIFQRDDGKFYYTAPITTEDNTKVGAFNIAVYKGSKIVAVYHTHPDGTFNSMFSDADVKFATKQNWISYVAVIGGENKIIKFIPGQTKPHQIVGKLFMGYVSEGVDVIKL